MRAIFFILALFVAVPAAADEPTTLYWEELLPEGENEILNEMYAQLAATAGEHNPYGNPMMSAMMPTQIGTFNVVDDLDGKRVRIPGFVLPFEYAADGKISEFLLVPYFGACIHSPPPPPNQMVYVTAEKPEDLGKQWNAIWAIGTLKTQRHMNDLGNAAYTLEIDSWEQYDG